MSLASNIVLERSTELDIFSSPLSWPTLVTRIAWSFYCHSDGDYFWLGRYLHRRTFLRNWNDNIALNASSLQVEYVCFEVIATLAAVEDPDPTTYLRLESNEPNGPDATELAVEEITQTATVGLRSAVRSLYAWHGVWSCFRGFRLYLAVVGIGKGAGYNIQPFLPTRTVSPILSKC